MKITLHASLLLLTAWGLGLPAGSFAQGHFVWAKQIGQSTTYIDILNFENAQIHCSGHFSGTQVIGNLVFNSTAGAAFRSKLDYTNGSLDDVNQNPVSGFRAKPGEFIQFAQSNSTFTFRKVNTGNQVLWSHQFTNPGGAMNIVDLAVDKDGNIFTIGFISGSQIKYDNISLNGAHNGIYVMKFDSYGYFIWHKKVSTSGSGISVDFFSNGDALAVCESNEDISMSRIGQGANLVWTKTIAHTDALDGIKAVRTLNDNFYVGGRFINTIQAGPSQGLVSTGNYDCFLAKYNANGELTWAKSYGGKGEDVLNDFVVDVDENVYCAGQFDNEATFGNLPLSDGQNNFSGTPAYVCKVAANGSFVEASTITAGFSAGNVSSFNRIALDPFGNVYLAGRTRGVTNFGNNVSIGQGISLLEEYSFVCKYGSGMVSGSDEQEMPTGHLTLAPNPSDGYFTIAAPESAELDASCMLEIFNLNGQRVLQQEYTPEVYSELHAGLYFVRILGKDRVAYMGKLMIR